MRIKRVLTVMFLCILFTKICSAALYYDEKNGITFDLDHSIYFSTFEIIGSKYERPNYSFAIVGNKKCVCDKSWYAPTYVTAAEVLPPKKAMRPFIEKYQKSGADIAIFLVGETILGNDHAGMYDIYITTKKNDGKDFCTLSERKLKAVTNKYVGDMKTTYAVVEEYKSGKNVADRNNTIQLIALDKKNNNRVVKRIVSRYGKIIEITSFFKHYDRKNYKTNFKNEKKLEAVIKYFDEICKNIDFDNSTYVDKKEQELYWRNV